MHGPLLREAPPCGVPIGATDHSIEPGVPVYAYLTFRWRALTLMILLDGVHRARSPPRELSRYTLHIVDVDEAHRIIMLFNLTAYAPFLGLNGSAFQAKQVPLAKQASVGHYNITGDIGHVNSPCSTD